MLSLKDLDEGVEILMDADGEASLLVDLLLVRLELVPVSDCLEVDVVGEFLLELHVPLLVFDGQGAGWDMSVVDVIDVEIFLACVGVDRVQLEKVLPSRRSSKPLPAAS